MPSEADNLCALLDKLLRRPLKTFPTSGPPNEATAELGVYVIYGSDECVLHVGSTPRAKGGITQRLNNHLRGKSSFVKKHFGGKGASLRGACKYRYLPVGKGRERALLEALAIGRLCPSHIGRGLDAAH